MKIITHTLLVFRRIGQIFWSLFYHFPYIRRGPVYLREVVEDLGGGFIKLAQILALRYEILPSHYCQELSNLFDRVGPFTGKEVQSVFQEEYGKSPEEVFKAFSYEPYKTASFGQVHLAMFDGRKVAVKVQKPGIRRRAQTDISIIKFFAALYGFFFSPPVSIKDVIYEWEVWTLRELDYRIEADNTKLLWRNNSAPFIYIPEVFDRISTSRILVTEFLEGWNLNDVIYRNVIELSPQAREEISRKIVWGQLAQYFRGYLSQADPHPGNIIIMKDGRLGYVDFGIVVKAGSPYQNYHFANFMRSAATGSVPDAIRHFGVVMKGITFQPEIVKDLGYRWRNKSPEKIAKGITKFLESKMAEVIKLWAESVSNTEASLYDRSTARHFVSLISLARKFGMEIPTNLLAYLRAVIIADMVCLILNPRFNMKEVLSEFFIQAPEICELPGEISVPPREAQTQRPVFNSELEVEREWEERQRLVERYLTYAERIIERALEEGSRALAYFATTKV